MQKIALNLFVVIITNSDINNKQMKHYFILLILLMSSTYIFGQNVISGVVIDNENNESLPGVSVFIKDTQIGTLTDIDGKYSIEAESGQIIVFSFISGRGSEGISSPFALTRFKPSRPTFKSNKKRKK